MQELFEVACGYQERLLSWPRWEQDWFPCLDGVMAYTMMRLHSPRRVIEVGSGHSTRLLAYGLEDAQGDGSGEGGEVLAIDPTPRVSHPRVAGSTLPGSWRIRWLREDVRTAAVNFSACDVVFVDSSHIMMPGSDVEMILLEVLPRMPAGVLVHFHDIFLPWAYPKSWNWREYNEQSAIAALLWSGRARILWSSAWFRHHHHRRVQDSELGSIPLVDGAYESSLWLRL